MSLHSTLFFVNGESTATQPYGFNAMRAHVRRTNLARQKHERIRAGTNFTLCTGTSTRKPPQSQITGKNAKFRRSRPGKSERPNLIESLLTLLLIQLVGKKLGAAPDQSPDDLNPIEAEDSEAPLQPPQVYSISILESTPDTFGPIQLQQHHPYTSRASGKVKISEKVIDLIFKSREYGIQAMILKYSFRDRHFPDRNRASLLPSSCR